MKKIIIFGPPGSGKSVLGRLLSKGLGLPLIDMGELLRKHVKSGDELGKSVSIYLKKGKLAPSSIVIKILKARLNEKDCIDGYVLEGFPRSLAQNNQFDIINESDLIIELAAPKDVLFKRITGRRICENCSAVYNVHPEFHSTPKIQGICDLCGGKLYQRTDDTLEVAKKRFELYASETIPLIKRYKKRIVKLNALEKPSQLVKQSIKTLKTLKNNKNGGKENGTKR